EKLQAELSGILRWAMEGCLLWQQEGLGDPQTVRTATEGYRHDMDVLANFLTECCEKVDGAWVSGNALYGAYTKWCQGSGEQYLPKRDFTAALVERGIKRGRTASERGWDSLRLVTGDSL